MNPCALIRVAVPVKCNPGSDEQLGAHSHPDCILLAIKQKT
jgi:hypothetical protein